MKIKRIKRVLNTTTVPLIENQILTVDTRMLEIDCLKGMIWITWPNGNEQVLTKGKSSSVRSRGRICIQAFSDASVHLRRIAGDNRPVKALAGKQIAPQFS